MFVQSYGYFKMDYISIQICWYDSVGYKKMFNATSNKVVGAAENYTEKWLDPKQSEVTKI